MDLFFCFSTVAILGMGFIFILIEDSNKARRARLKEEEKERSRREMQKKREEEIAKLKLERDRWIAANKVDDIQLVHKLVLAAVKSTGTSNGNAERWTRAIVEKFGSDTVNVLDWQPDRLVEIRTIYFSYLDNFKQAWRIVRGMPREFWDTV